MCCDIYFVTIYEYLEQVRKQREQFQGSMHWKRVSGQDYLYRGYTGGRAASLGVRTRETEEIKHKFDAEKNELATTYKSLSEKIKMHAGFIRAANLNRLPVTAAKVIRKFNNEGIPYLIIGTNALYVFEQYAGVQIAPQHLATMDVDILMDSRQAIAHGHSLGHKANPYLFAQAVSSAYQELGPFEGVVGHSMGGNAVATAVAECLEPPRVVLISSPSSIENVLQRFASFVGLPQRSKHRFVRLIEDAVGKPSWALNTACNIRNTQAKGLIIHDRADREIPFSEAEQILKEWPSASLYATDGYGHRAIVRQPLVWKKVAEFLG